MRQYSLPSDALPVEVGDAYESLLHALSDWLSAPSPFASTNLADYFEEHLASFDAPEGRIRYLYRLTLQGGVNGEAYPEAAMDLVELQSEFRAFPDYTDTDLDLYFDEYYFSWLAVRLTEALCEYTGRARLRAEMGSLAPHPPAVPPHRRQYRPTATFLICCARALCPKKSHPQRPERNRRSSAGCPNRRRQAPAPGPVAPLFQRGHALLGQL
jgi:hypothetical protein